MKVMIFTIHNTTPWWSYLASRLEFASQTVVVSDLRGDGDISILDSFYRRLRNDDTERSALRVLGPETCEEVIQRCRTLRSLNRTLALRMIGAMWLVFDELLDAQRPDLVMTFTIDRYVMDVLDRAARRRNIPFIEMTPSILPGQIMLMNRGRLIGLREPDEHEVEAALETLDDANFAPTYVKDSDEFSLLRYWKIFTYFELRGMAFNALRWLRRDPLNLHYLDARKNLKHKVRLSDYKALSYLRKGWQESLNKAREETRVFLGLQLFPEASLDYWLENVELLRHDEVIVRICRVLQGAGYHIFVKDHPLQFGFRQLDLIARLSELPGVTLLPYHVPAVLMIRHCPVSVTLTGTIGFQAALAGCRSVVSDPYYAVDGHFVSFNSMADIDELPGKIAAFDPPGDLVARRKALVRHLLCGSVPGDYFSFKRFNPARPDHVARTETLVRSLNAYIPRLVRASERERWQDTEARAATCLNG